MKRTFADLHLCLENRKSEHATRLLEKASELGYGLVAVTFGQNVAPGEIEKLRKTCKHIAVDVASRVDLKPRTADDLLRDLRRVRRKFELVGVSCESKSVSRQAAKDRRVDMLFFPSIDFRRRFFDAAEAELASTGVASFEVDLRPLLVLNGPSRIRLLSSLRREVAVSKHFGVPIIISSGVSEELLMRKPMEMAALASLFGLKQEAATDAVSENPVTIIRRNREKLSPRFVSPGIRIIRKGSDC